MATEQQLLFQAVCDVFGWDTKTLTKTSRTRVGKVAAELREVGATPDEVRFAREAWERMWGGRADQPTLTDTSITAWWPEIVKRYRARGKVLQRRAVQQEEVQEGPYLPREENARRFRVLLGQLGVKRYTDLLEDVVPAREEGAVGDLEPKRPSGPAPR